jgi:hypothetical protein
MPKLTLRNLFAVVTVAAILVAWWSDRKRLHKTIRRLQSVDWIAIMETDDHGLAVRSRGQLQRMNFPAITESRIDPLATHVEKQYCGVYTLYVREWDADKATAILADLWGEEMMRKCRSRLDKEGYRISALHSYRPP